MTNLTENLALLSRRVGDVNAVVSRMDRRLGEPLRLGPSPRDLLGKLLNCYAQGARMSRVPALIAAEVYRNDPALLDALAKPGAIAAKAAVGPARTDQVSWALELTSAPNVGLLQLVAPSSIYSQLSQREAAIRATLIGSGFAKVPSRAQPATPGTSPFVTESEPIKVKKFATTTATINSKKAAFITVATDELIARSAPEAEAYLRSQLAADVSVGLDGVLLGSAPSDAANPPGLLFGLTPVAASPSTGLEGFAADLRALAATVEATGPLVDPVLIMSSTSGLLVSVLSQGGAADMPIIASPNVPAKKLILVDASNFCSGEGDTPVISSSRNAVLHMEDTDPAPIGSPGSPPIAAAPSMSLYQADAVALRIIQHVSWVMTRPGRVSFIDTVSW